MGFVQGAWGKRGSVAFVALMPRGKRGGVAFVALMPRGDRALVVVYMFCMLRMIRASRGCGCAAEEGVCAVLWCVYGVLCDV